MDLSASQKMKFKVHRKVHGFQKIKGFALILTKKYLKYYCVKSNNFTCNILYPKF